MVHVWPEIELSAGDAFDDQHGGRAGGATQLSGCFGAVRAGSGAEQRATACEGVFPSSVGEEAEVADADQTFGQNVQKKSAQELIR